MKASVMFMTAPVPAKGGRVTLFTAQQSAPFRARGGQLFPVAIIPLDNPDALLESAAAAVNGGGVAYKSLHPEDQQCCRDAARDALTAVGIPVGT